MPSPPAEVARRWVFPAVMLAFAPKCALCVFGYAGLGAALGLAGPELCGASAAPPAPWLWLSAPGLALGWLALRRRES